MTPDFFHNLLATKPAFLLYFINNTCSVCQALRPKLEGLLKVRFPEIEFIGVDAAESREFAGQLQMMTVPGILLFLEGREYLRSSGMTSITELEEKIGRFYGLMFGE